MTARESCITVTLVLTALLSAQRIEADWRGDGTGVYPDADPPLQWSSNENVGWRTSLPSWSNSGVVKAGDLLFVCAEPNLLLCFDANTGKELWQRRNPGQITLSKEDQAQYVAAVNSRREYSALLNELKALGQKLQIDPNDPKLILQKERVVPEAKAARARLVEAPKIPTATGHQETGESSPTPVADMERSRVYAFFATGVVVCYDFTGNRIWARAVPMGPAQYGHTSSPVFTSRRLIISHGDTSGLDPDTGDTVWTVKGNAKHGTPVLTNIGDTRVVITPSGQCLRSADGGLVCTNLPPSDFNSPVVHKGVAYYVGIDGIKATAYGLPRQTYSPAPALKLWEAPLRKGRYFASPILHNGTLFGAHQSGQVYAIDAATGKITAERMYDEMHERFGQIYTSVALAGEQLYVFSDNGTVLVFSSTPALELTYKTQFAKMRGNPHFEGGRIYLRSMSALVRIGQ